MTQFRPEDHNRWQKIFDDLLFKHLTKDLLMDNHDRQVTQYDKEIAAYNKRVGMSFEVTDVTPVLRRAFKAGLEHGEAERGVLRDALIAIEMKTRVGGQWNPAEINEAARIALGGKDYSGSSA